MTKASHARKMRYRKRLDTGETVAALYVPDPEEVARFIHWTLTSDDPDAAHGRAWLMQQDVSDFEMPDILELRHIDERLN